MDKGADGDAGTTGALADTRDAIGRGGVDIEAMAFVDKSADSADADTAEVGWNTGDVIFGDGAGNVVLVVVDDDAGMDAAGSEGGRKMSLGSALFRSSVLLRASSSIPLLTASPLKPLLPKMGIG